jgi:hypothetical protein
MSKDRGTIYGLTFLIAGLILQSQLVYSQQLSTGLEISAPDLFSQFEFTLALGEKHEVGIFRHQGLVNEINFTGLAYYWSPWGRSGTFSGIGLRAGVYDMIFIGMQPLLYVQHNFSEIRWTVKGEFSWRQGYPAISARLGFKLWQ